MPQVTSLRVFVTYEFLTIFVQEAEKSCILLLLPECAKTADLCAMRQNQMYAENRRLRCETSGGLHNRFGDGGTYT